MLQAIKEDSSPDDEIWNDIMGLSEIRELIKPVIKEIELQSLSGKVVAIDAFNALYQFLSTIRQPDGTPLMDSKGRVTSHLSGLFYRTKNLLEEGIKPIYVFDGRHPEFKKEEQKRREEIKKKMEEKYKQVLELGIKEDLKKYAQGTARLTPEMVQEAKRLLDAMGIPYVQAPSEGEAQAAYLVKSGKADYTASKDYDSLLFGSPQVVRNLSITGRRKLPNGRTIEVKPEVIKLSDVLDLLKLDQKQLIAMALIIGTDYNPDGIPGYGPKKAYETVRKFKDLGKLFKYVGWEKHYDVDWRTLIEFFENPPVREDIEIEWREPDEEKIIKILVEEHDFSEERVKKAISEIKKAHKKGRQTSLLSFI